MILCRCSSCRLTRFGRIAHLNILGYWADVDARNQHHANAFSEGTKPPAGLTFPATVSRYSSWSWEQLPSMQTFVVSAEDLPSGPQDVAAVVYVIVEEPTNTLMQVINGVEIRRLIRRSCAPRRSEGAAGK